MGVCLAQSPLDQLNGSTSLDSSSRLEIINEINDAVERFLNQQNASIDTAIAAGAIPFLVQLLKDKQGEEKEELHIAALRGLLCIALSEKTEHAQAIADAGAIPYLLDFTSSQDEFLISVALNVLNRMTIQLGVNCMFPLNNRMEDFLKLAQKNLYLTELSLILVNRLLKEITISDKEFKLCVSTLSSLQLDCADVYLVNAMLECLVLLSNFAKKSLGSYLLEEGVMDIFANIIRCLSQVNGCVFITGLGRCLSKLFKIERKLVLAALETGILEELYFLATNEIQKKNENLQCEVSWAIAAIVIHGNEETVTRILQLGYPPSPLKFHRGRGNDEYRMAVSLMSRILSRNEHVEIFLQYHVIPMMRSLQQEEQRAVLASFLNSLKTSLKRVKRAQDLNQVIQVMKTGGGVQVIRQIQEGSNPHTRRVAGEILDMIR